MDKTIPADKPDTVFHDLENCKYRFIHIAHPVHNNANKAEKDKINIQYKKMHKLQSVEVKQRALKTDTGLCRSV